MAVLMPAEFLSLMMTSMRMLALVMMIRCWRE
jgi:hypothetical protein